jgi:hypothetical protein
VVVVVVIIIMMNDQHVYAPDIMPVHLNLFQPRQRRNVCRHHAHGARRHRKRRHFRPSTGGAHFCARQQDQGCYIFQPPCQCDAFTSFTGQHEDAAAADGAGVAVPHGALALAAANKALDSQTLFQSEIRESHSVFFDMGFMPMAAALLGTPACSDNVIVNASGIVTNMCELARILFCLLEGSMCAHTRRAVVNEYTHTRRAVVNEYIPHA